ncbi:zinc finger CCHC domain-containing protein 3 [Monodelphis domestica]|uniref:zinc finger CCHC domain-containing protein 3 n=1 Tax=Monodelphis domestica TaxID=13616 RepID=UPI00020F5960|nr:zinc finger CCHC domain-containing protein 3 [Monodelphis domestica]
MPSPELYSPGFGQGHGECQPAAPSESEDGEGRQGDAEELGKAGGREVRKKKREEEGGRRKKTDAAGFSVLSSVRAPGGEEEKKKREEKRPGAASLVRGKGPQEDAFNGRFILRLRFQGEDNNCPTRDYVVGTLIIKSIGMNPRDIYAVIQIPGSKEFDVSFRSAEKFDFFLRKYQEKKGQDCWENFVLIQLTKPRLKTLFILFRNETVDTGDIVTWLKRHCDVLTTPVKVADRFGVWTGEYKCEIELWQGEEGVDHLPGAFYLGAEKGYSWYKGQPKTCYRCGSKNHMSLTCSQEKCFRCGEQGHSTTFCKKGIVCNLCGQKGHIYANCPSAGHSAGITGE